MILVRPAVQCSTALRSIESRDEGRDAYVTWLHDLAHADSAWGKIFFALIIVAAFLAVDGLLLLLSTGPPRRGRKRSRPSCSCCRR